MSLAGRIFEALRSGLVVALLAPLLAGAVFMLAMAVFAARSGERLDTSAGSLVLLFLGVASGAYFLGGIPAFVAGLALPVLRARFSSALAALCSGLVGTLVSLATFGSHLFGQPHPAQSILTLCGPALIGTAIATLAVPRHESEA